jgi:hypothetical protein
MDDSPRQLPGVHKIELVQVNADSFCRLASNTAAQVDPSLQSPSDKTAKNSRQDANIANFLLSRPTSPQHNATWQFYPSTTIVRRI